MNKEFDALLRLHILEGVAGVPWGIWDCQVPATIALATIAQKALPHLEPAWFSPEPQGLLRNVKKGIQAGGQWCGVDPSQEDIEDAIEAVLSSEAAYKVGQKIGPVPVLTTARHYLGRRGFHQMLDILRAEETRLRQQGILQVNWPAPTPPEDLLSLTPKPEVLQWLRVQIGALYYKSPSKHRIAYTLLDHPEWTGAQVAHHLGMVAPCAKDGLEGCTYVNRVIREMLSNLRQVARNIETCSMSPFQSPIHTPVLQWLDAAEQTHTRWALDNGMQAA